MCFTYVMFCYFEFTDLILGNFQLGAMTSDDPACVKPCITVLNKLNSQFYMELKNEVKVLLAVYLFIFRVCCCHS